MALSSDLVSQFSKITNDSGNGKKTGQLRGIITKYDEKLYVQLDGSNELTPIARTVEVAEGDRVEVTIANHSATVTGNLSDPSIGVMRAGALESKIAQTAAQIRLELSDESKKLSSALTLTASEIRQELSDEINGVNSKITQNAESITTLVQKNEDFSKFQQTVEGFSFMGKGGTVKISGGDITLTGSITFEDLDTDTQDKIDNATDTANSASSTASTALNRANTAISDSSDAIDIANEAYGVATSISLPDYIKSTHIEKALIKSPTIEGNEVKVYGTFQTIGYDGVNQKPTGYMGAAMGQDEYGNDTFGVALSNSWDYASGTIGRSYVIVTGSGVRLQYMTNNLVVSEKGIWLNVNDGKAYYNDVEIGSGGGGTAVFG